MDTIVSIHSTVDWLILAVIVMGFILIAIRVYKFFEPPKGASEEVEDKYEAAKLRWLIRFLLSLLLLGVVMTGLNLIS